jgi:hypothetical protein
MTIFDDLIPLITPASTSEPGDVARPVDLPQALPREVKIKKTSENNTLRVERADMGQDPIISFLGGSYTTAGDTLDTQRNSVQDFQPSLIVTDFSGSAGLLGGTTTHLIVQPVGQNISISQAEGSSYGYTVYDNPVAPIESAKATYGIFIEDYEEAFTSELAMLDVYGTMLSLTDGALNSAATRDVAPLPAHPGVSWDAGEKEELITYFKEFATSNPPPALNYENVIFPHSSVADANSAFINARDAFPFFVGFDINLDTSGDVCSSLIQTKYADKFTTNIAATIDNGDIFERTPFMQQNLEGVSADNPRVYDANLLATYDASAFMSKAVVLGNTADLREAFPESQPTFNDTIEALQYLMDMRNISAQNALNAIDISLGKKCYSETVVYRIAKFSEDDDTSPVQNFYLFNTPDASVFNFMDSQVIPGKVYTYKVFSYSFVAATTYEYASIKDEETFDVLTVKTTPSTKIVENLIFQTTALVTSLPPVAPEIEFRSFIGEEGRIQILLQDSTQRITQQPITLSQEEERRIRGLRESQGLLPGAPLTFFNDDNTKVYEIYRTPIAPDNVNSFEDKLWRRVTEHAVLDAVQSDKTYYYMFRTIDNHGNISNPSSPYEVTLIGGVSPYILVNDYEYPSVSAALRSSTKNFKRFLRVRPALQQLMVNLDSGIQSKPSSLDVNKVDAGVATQGQVWGKKYKIRIISKETGKKIDFNIKYDYNFDYREQ